MNTESIPLGKRIRLARNHRDLSQRELADRIGLHETYISLMESGKTNPTDKQLSAIEAALGLSFNDPRVKAAFAILAGNNHLPEPAHPEPANV